MDKVCTGHLAHCWEGGGFERVLVYVIGYNVCSATLSLMNSWPFLVHGKSYLVSIYIVNREA